MRIKSRVILCTIFIIITVATLVIGYIYELEQYKTIIHKQKQQYNIQTEQSKEQIHIEKTIDTESDKEVDTQAVQPVSLGVFKLTAYCSCEKCCGIWANNRPNGIVYGAIGEELKEGYSIAVDPNVIPYKTEVIIDGKVYAAQDCGGAIKGNRIDVYFENHNDALEFGVQYSEVFVNL